MKRRPSNKTSGKKSFPARPPASPQNRRIAILVEIPADDPEAAMRGLRWLLKRALRAFGLRCLALRDPSETRTFGNSETDRSNPSERDDEKGT
jgi:hypothetical protein